MKGDVLHGYTHRNRRSIRSIENNGAHTRDKETASRGDEGVSVVTAGGSGIRKAFPTFGYEEKLYIFLQTSFRLPQSQRCALWNGAIDSSRKTIFWKDRIMRFCLRPLNIET